MRLGLIALLAGLLIAGEARAEAMGGPYPVPRFRHIDADAKPPKLDPARKFTLLADNDFPPFSYVDTTGEPKGLAVDLALAACAKLTLQCTVRAVPWANLGPALSRGEGDAVISGLKLDDESLAAFEPTRPVYRAFGRFAVQTRNPIAQPSIRLLAGKRVGVVASSTHEAWLKRYFPQSQIISLSSLADAEEALRTAKIDALFGDALNLVYWTKGSASEGCCRLVDGAFVDEDYFTRSFAFFVRRGDMELRQALDYGLDRVQVTGDWDHIFHSYVPASPW